jgi:hypothetical protein
MPQGKYLASFAATSIFSFGEAELYPRSHTVMYKKFSYRFALSGYLA